MVLLSRRITRKARHSETTQARNSEPANAKSDGKTDHSFAGVTAPTFGKTNIGFADDTRESPVNSSKAQKSLTATILFEQSMLPSSTRTFEETELEQEESAKSRCSWLAAAAVLEHSYQLCGHNSDIQSRHQVLNKSRNSLSYRDDPTVNESFEIIVNNQESHSHDANSSLLGIPPSPRFRIFPSKTQTLPLHSSEPRKAKDLTRVLHVETVERAHNDNVDVPDRIPIVEENNSTSVGIRRCPCATQSIPLHPRLWPQRPLLLLPSRGTSVLGIRYCNSTSYLWKPGDSGTWFTALWKIPASLEGTSCGQCCSLPINNGNESEALVTDFVTPLFRGTLLVRIRDAKGTTNNTKEVYFRGMNRRYQAVVVGKFLHPIDLVSCVTGFKLDRPCGKLPPKWIVKSALRVMHFFAPQLQAVIDSSAASYALTPLGSTPQCIVVGDDQIDIQGVLQEPEASQHTLLGTTSGQSSMQRARLRKKLWDKRYQDGSPMPANTSTTYVFEFLQHLFDFHQLQLDLGSLGSIGLQAILKGQPLSILALHRSSPLWSFDLWHEQLYDDALQYKRESRFPT